MSSASHSLTHTYTTTTHVTHHGKHILDSETNHDIVHTRTHTFAARITNNHSTNKLEQTKVYRTTMKNLLSETFTLLLNANIARAHTCV